MSKARQGVAHIASMMEAAAEVTPLWTRGRGEAATTMIAACVLRLLQAARLGLGCVLRLHLGYCSRCRLSSRLLQPF